MSAFDRLPADYRALCVRYAAVMGKFQGMPPRPTKISPQNRRVRFEVDLSLAHAKTFTHRPTRQQRRSGRR